MSDSPGLVDFAIGLVNPVLNLPEGYSNNRRTVINAAHQNFLGATYKTLGLLSTYEQQLACMADFLCTLYYAWDPGVNYDDLHYI